MIASDPAEDARVRLASVVAALARRHRRRLEELKAEQRGVDREDFVWHYMLQSFSTWGSSRGFDGLMRTPANYDRVRFEALLPLTPRARELQIEAALRDGRVRMPKKKASMLAENLGRIVALGGLAAAKRALLDAPGAEGKMRFLVQFRGIGPKYARNILMDVYHEDFRDRIAIDQRILRVVEAIGVEFDTYDACEAYLLDVARDAGLNGWELDRILYNYTDEVIGALGVPVVHEANAPRLRDELHQALGLLDAGDMAGARRLILRVVGELECSLPTAGSGRHPAVDAEDLLT